MLNDYLTSKWILAGAAFLILFAGACLSSVPCQNPVPLGRGCRHG